MNRILFVAAIVVIASGSTVYAKSALTEQQVEGVEMAIKAMGCTVEDSDIMAKGDGYKADDVDCKDGQYDMTLDKDFKVTDRKRGLDTPSIHPLPKKAASATIDIVALASHGTGGLAPFRRQGR